MVGRKLPKALEKNPKAFVDVSTGLMNVPGSVSKLPASGVDFTVKGTVSTRKLRSKKPGKGFREGKTEGKRLSMLGKKTAIKRLRN